MRPRGSSLNPRATSFIPRTNREDNKTVITENSSNDGIGERMGRGQNAPVAVVSPVNNPPARGPVSQRSNELIEREKFDAQFKLDMKYLLDNFCKLTEEYLTDAYLESKCDLEAAVAMLKQRQIEHERLPDSLGIGDTSEPESAAGRQPSSKKNVAKGSSSSSSRSR